MDIKQLTTFKVVADLLSFNRAADRLHCSQSTVSAQILALEEELGVRLFDRLGRKILLTQAGRTLYPYTSRMLDLQDAARAELIGQSDLAGSLTIRVPDSLCVHRMAPVSAAFRERMPRVDVAFITCAQEGLARDLANGLIDLAFLLTDMISGADLSVEALGTEEIVSVASPDHPLSRMGPVTAADLSRWPFLVSRVDCSYRRIVQSAMAQGGGEARTPLEFHSAAAVISHARRGLGWTALPRIAVADDLRQGHLAPLAWDEGTFEAACLMIRRRDRWASPILSAFMDTARQHLYGAGD